MTLTVSSTLFLGGERRAGQGAEHRVIAPGGHQTLATLRLAHAEDLQSCLDAAHATRKELAREPSFKRQQRLHQIAGRLEERQAEFAETLVHEAGKPMRYAKGEVLRACRTFRAAAEEAVRFYGEVMPLDTTPPGMGRTGLLKRVPAGLCTFITPFNFPLNLVAHKVAPAIAVGCPFVLKPAEKTPLVALLLGEILSDLSPALPKGSWSIAPALPLDSAPLVDDPRVKHFSFTGSAKVGWELKRRASHAHVTLELGGNAASILEPDWDLDDALNRCAIGAFAYSGQVCISLQRLLVHSSQMEATVAGLSRRAASLQRGPVLENSTEIGPMINHEAAKRVENWIRQAQSAGAIVHTGGKRDDNFVEPTVLTQVPREQPTWCEEIFGPVVVVESYEDFDQALHLVNDSPYGLQASLFTHDWRKIKKAWDELEVGQLIVGESPVFRVDEMPYGGVKQSGSGREGIRFAMEAMTEQRLLIL